MSQRARAWRDLGRVLGLFMPYRSWLGAGAAVALVALLANVGLLAVAGEFIALMALAGLSGAALNYFTPAALIRALALVRTGGRYAERLLTHEATFRLLAGLRVWFYLRLEPLAPARLQHARTGDLLSRIQADIDTLNQAYLRLFVPLIVGGAAVLLITAGLAWFSPLAALSTAVLLLSCGVALPAWTRARGAAPGRGALLARARLRAELNDLLAGAAELRIGASELHWRDKVLQASADLQRHQRALGRLDAWSVAALGLGANLGAWTAALAALPGVASGAMPPAHLAMLVLFALAAFEAVAPLPQAFALLGEVLAAARRIFALADARPAVAEPAVAAALPDKPDLVIRGLRMAYEPEGPWALDGLDLDLPAGVRLALVGASGAGKSSLVQVLARFWPYQAGSVRLGGVELSHLRGDDARAAFAVVSQRSHLFNATLRENLLLADPAADAARIDQACRAARLDAWIQSLPQGLDTPLGEGGTLVSGGQARRIALARAMLKNAPVLMLDEPTEGLDALTERELHAALAQATQGRSVLLITHRLGTLADLVDQVAVLDGGRVVQRGSPRDLAAVPGPYRELHAVLGGA